METEKKALFSQNEMHAIAGFFGFALGVMLFTFFTANYYSMNEPVTFKIKKGESFNEVVYNLSEEKIISSEFNLKFAAFVSGSANNVKAGIYKIPNGLTYFELLEVLLKGVPAEQKLITIPEGIWQHELAGLLRREMGIDSAKFMELSEDPEFIKSLNIDTDNLEGYLLPETYYFHLDWDEKDMIRKLAGAMNEIFDTSVKSKINKLGLTKHSLLTMASIIDGESNKVSEFRRISGVYYNRLNRGMLLQADPTVQYLIRHKKRNNRVLFKDLEIDSRYNTYIYKGLPPGPINNPGKDAILAALYPEKHELFYFVYDGNGGHEFSKYYSEHIKNVEKYRRWLRSQK